MRKPHFVPLSRDVTKWASYSCRWDNKGTMGLPMLLFSIIIILIVIIVIQAVVIISLRKPRPMRPAAGKIAIVLDDWGYNVNNIPVLEEIKAPLTLSILPHLKFSRQVSDEGRRMGSEVILHLPAEPHELVNLEQNTAMVSMNQEEIKEIVVSALADIRFAKGVSNHMGGKFTEDYASMFAVMSVLKKKRLYYLDSFVTSKSVCREVARKLKLPFARRDIFLDNEEDALYIKGQLNKLKKKARMYGYAIGIGHDRPTTLAVLKEVIPQFQKEGYKFVFVSELAK